MPQTIFGLPVHPLVVHATVVFVPLAVLLVLLAVLVPRFRDWAGWMPAAVSLVALVLTPLSTASGENLEHSLGHSQLIEEHAELGDLLLWFTLPLFLLAAGHWWLRNRAASTPRNQTLLRAVSALAVVAALATGVQVALIGHSGAKASWSGVVSSAAQSQ